MAFTVAALAQGPLPTEPVARRERGEYTRVEANDAPLCSDTKLAAGV